VPRQPGQLSRQGQSEDQDQQGRRKGKAWTQQGPGAAASKGQDAAAKAWTQQGPGAAASKGQDEAATSMDQEQQQARARMEQPQARTRSSSKYTTHIQHCCAAKRMQCMSGLVHTAGAYGHMQQKKRLGLHRQPLQKAIAFASGLLVTHDIAVAGKEGCRSSRTGGSR